MTTFFIFNLFGPLCLHGNWTHRIHGQMAPAKDYERVKIEGYKVEILTFVGLEFWITRVMVGNRSLNEANWPFLSLVFGHSASSIAFGSAYQSFHLVQVILLESRSRIGGRVHTDYSFGFPVDMGASWLVRLLLYFFGYRVLFSILQGICLIDQLLLICGYSGCMVSAMKIHWLHLFGVLGSSYTVPVVIIPSYMTMI